MLAEYELDPEWTEYMYQFYERSEKQRGDAAEYGSLASGDELADRHLADWKADKAWVHCRFCHVLFTVCGISKMHPASEYIIDQVRRMKESHVKFYNSCMKSVNLWTDADWLEYASVMNSHVKGAVVGFVPEDHDIGDEDEDGGRMKASSRAKM
jgi:hypothetical protein